MTNGPIMLTYNDPGGPSHIYFDKLREAAERGDVFALPPDAKIEHIEPRPPRRTLGAWRHKVATPEALLATLCGSPGSITPVTYDALRVLDAALLAPFA